MATSAKRIANSSNSTPSLEIPSINLPRGGGAIRGIGEKFAANPVTGTGSMSIPVPCSPGRSGFGPQLGLSYDSGAGNSPFGFGWSLSLPAITRKTDKGLPQYQDAEDSDVFLLSGSEDLVPVLQQNAADEWVREKLPPRTVGGVQYGIDRYRPRIEGLFARIERWTDLTKTDDVFWRSISKDDITTWYGRDGDSRIVDPADQSRIFSWLICESSDAKGNVIVYRYDAENDEKVDPKQVSERNRVHTANRYLKRILYGNHAPYLPKIEADSAWSQPPGDGHWYFEVVFDYGDHDETKPTPQPSGTWMARTDAFSSYRSTFEIRTHRLCQRVLMFHHIPNDPGSTGYDGLVRSTDFTYKRELEAKNAHVPVYSKLVAVTQRSYQRKADGSYLFASFPPVEFSYSDAVIQTELRELKDDNLPNGIDGTRYQWLDLDGEGLSGVLTEQGNGWFYKRNLSPINPVGSAENLHIEARFAPVERVDPILSLALAHTTQFLDLAGDGRPDVVQFAGTTPGFFERTMDEQWESFVPFRSLPKVNWNDPNLKFIDLDGDGHADILISEDTVFVWHLSLGEAGFAAQEQMVKGWDEEQSPTVIFADGTHSIYLADMSGDGLTDIVRIKNGEICYWANLGYGRFGAKITMDNAPTFDEYDQFNQRRIRLADIDGTGTTDILYLHRQGVQVFFNQSGNSWSKATLIEHSPKVDSLVEIQALDLLGNGTACLVWSSPLPGDAQQPLRYLDLMGGQKPHLLVKTVNNLGAETTLQYAPSTKFYLQDKQAGTPWVTKLPFPVHCVEKITLHDTWRETRFSSTYSYHHGYFDGTEREFRGFGRVEQIDVEDYGTFAAGNTASPYITDDKTLYQPPVKTVTWYHTGAFLDHDRMTRQFQHEYFPNWFEGLSPGQQVLGTFQENILPEPDLDLLDLSHDEWREAIRACKGMLLRQEVYELDADLLMEGIHQPVKLFTTAYHNCHIDCVQPRASNPHAVFYCSESEAITYHYELELRSETLTPDPRITHTLNLGIDEYGNLQQAVMVVYPRLGTYVDVTLTNGAQTLIQSVQAELHLSYVETRYTNDILDPDDYRLRLPCEVQTYELTGITTRDADDGLTPDVIDDRYFTLDELRAYKLSDKYQSNGTPVQEIAYQLLPNRVSPQKRLVEHIRMLFFQTSLDKSLLLGQLNALALPYETYQLALSDDLLNLIFNNRLTPPVKAALADNKISGYLSGSALSARFGAAAVAGEYWLCAGTPGFTADAAQHFYLPERYTDPFGNVTTLEYDPRDLYLRASTDALDNRTEVALFDFRMLTPRQLKDANGNLSEVRFDILGLPTAAAVMGKGAEADNLSGFDDALLNPELAAKRDLFVERDYDAAVAKQLLRSASTRHIYYFGEVVKNGETVWGEHPPCACSILRERHTADLPDSPLQVAFEYSDGLGSVLLKKVQAEPEPGNQILSWVVSGKTILNNKGKPVKQYEPYFSPPAVGHRFEEPAEAGVTPLIYYDAVGRVIRTEMPDGSYSRVEFSAWHATTYDPNDTVSTPENTWFARNSAPTASLEDQRAARLAAEHADTPAMTLLDSLGREVVTIAHNRVGALVDEKYITFSRLDAEGKPLWIQDARGNRVMQYITPPLPDGMRRFDDLSNLNPQGFAPCYDLAGNLLFQHSMDVGDRWMLNDAMGKPMFGWSSRQFVTRTAYDKLHRPTGLFVTGADPNNLAREIQFEKLVYGEGQANPQARNLRGKVFEHSDTAGIVTSEAYDYKGNPSRMTRQLLLDYKMLPDWSQPLTLAAERFVTSTRYDALNRPVQTIAPHSTARINFVQPTYNAAGLLERIDVWLNQAAEPPDLLDPATASLHAVANINYNAKGQRTRIEYNEAGHPLITEYSYDPNTFRLIRLITTRPLNPDPTSRKLQDLIYTYDPVGNITQIRDEAQDRVFHDNACVLPGAEYRYDALYRLVAASGREHEGNGQPYGWDDTPHYVSTLPNDCQALQNYVEVYGYDSVGNILEIDHHEGRNLEAPGVRLWNRRYQYALDSNRLLATSLPGDPANLPAYVAAPGYSAHYAYDPHGNMTAMPHLPTMQWDFSDQLSATTQQVVNNGSGETTYYIYDAGGQRVRKVTERQNGTRKAERIYLGGFEVYREYSGNAVALERESVHVIDDTKRVALVETQTVRDQAAAAVLNPVVRYQLGNHLGSVSLEVDNTAAVISYEEYTPYGSTAYCAGRSAAEVSLKRYRYTGKERDKESGLYYHGARYYVPWLGRWTNCDLSGVRSGTNLFRYAANQPIHYLDPDGRDPVMPNDRRTPEERERSFHDPEGYAKVVEEVKAGQKQVSTWDLVQAGAGLAVGLAKHKAIMMGVPPRMVDFSRVTEVGPARQGFLANTFGAPFQPPTDPADKKEWERGENVAALVQVGSMTSGTGGGIPGPQPKLAPVPGGMGPKVVAQPAVVPFGAPPYMASKKKEEEPPKSSSSGSPTSKPPEPPGPPTDPKPTPPPSPAPKTKTFTNSAGQEVKRTLVANEDALLAEAEKHAGGSLDKWTEFKPNWWINPKKDVKIEFNLEGHKNVNEGPHVTVHVDDGKGGWRVTEKIFIEGRESYSRRQ